MYVKARTPPCFFEQKCIPLLILNLFKKCLLYIFVIRSVNGRPNKPKVGFLCLFLIDTVGIRCYNKKYICIFTDSLYVFML